MPGTNTVVIALTAVVLASSSFPAIQRPQEARNARHEKIKAYLTDIRDKQQRTMNIDVAEGERLYQLVRQLNAKRVLEIGTSNGYSTIWMAMGLEETGGKIVSIEFDKGRHDLAVENFRKLGLDRLADLRFADALKEVPRIEGPFDLVFIDAWKEDYGAYFDMVFPKVRSGGAIAAHDTTSYAKEMATFLKRIKSNPALKTEFLSLGPNGMSISFKK
ncbi:MAG TPA: class I SAM-dependent methyltransferase [Bryobacteraceae bacterium]|nr:class I SAM-dependent methyltransferase [Bryobacteraceae bacterium]